MRFREGEGLPHRKGQKIQKKKKEEEEEEEITTEKLVVFRAKDELDLMIQENREICRASGVKRECTIWYHCHVW